MKIIVHHDEQGAITLVCVARQEPDGKLVMLPAPGECVSEVEASSVQHARDREHLREIRERYRIEIHQGTPRLIPR